MLNNPGAAGNWSGQRIPEGTRVFDVNGAKVGTVDMFNAEGGYLVVRKGLIFPKDIYVPLQAITGSNQDGVRLNVTHDELFSGRWDQPPAPTMETGTVSGMATGTTRGPAEPLAEREQTISTPATHEEAHVEHTPMSGRPVEPGEEAFQERDFEVPVTGEEPVTGKQASDTLRPEHMRAEQVDEQVDVLESDDEMLGQYEGEPPPDRQM